MEENEEKMKEKLYEEIGYNYRFFLRWRHAAFAGNLIIVYGVISLTITVFKEKPNLSFLIPLIASPIGILLWMIDRRTRDLYHAAIKAGKELEGGTSGFYTILNNEVILPKDSSSFKRITQSGALNILFWGTSIVFLILSFILCRLTTG